jgi:glycosyltransferase involved in cell wall biosynthesis
MPRVSVCCSVLNQSEWLKEMIASVFVQTFKDWELIIVDDGSTEDIKAVVDSFKDERIIYHRFHKNKGIPHGINWAMNHARGEFINPLAADELLTPDKFETQVKFMDENPDIHCIWGLPQNGPVGLRPTHEQYSLRAHNRSNLAWVRTLINLENVPIGGASMLCRKSVFQDIGYFDQQLEIFSDHEWFVRFFKHGYQGRILPYRWMLSRHNPNAVSRNMKGSVREINYVRQKHRVDTPIVDRKVTVAIPVFNMANYLPETLDSVFKQTVQPTEILIVDDCSTDNLSEVVSQYKDPRIKFFKFEENQGNVKAQNFMLTQATGTFYIPLSADDTLDPKYIEKLLNEFEQNPWLEFCASHTDFIDEAGNTITEPKLPFQEAAMSIPKPTNLPREKFLGQLYYGNLYFGVGTYRTQALREVGGWENHGVISDYEMYLRLLQRENIKIVEEPLTHTRLHDRNQSNLSVNKPGEGKTLQQLYRDAKAPYFAQRMKVIIATPFYEMKAFSPYVSSLASTIKLLTMLGIEHEFWELAGDSYVARARNTICTKFLEDVEATDLFFIDSDMSWNADAFVRMLMLPEGIVGASYPAKNMWESWTSIPEVREENGKFHPVGRPLQDGTALLNADTVATGFMRIKRQALEAFRDHYPQHRYKEPGADQSAPDREYIEFFATAREDGLWYGEDRMFCKRLKEMGQDLFIYPNVTVSHFGVKAWTGNYDKFLRGKRGNSIGANSPGV